MCNLEKFVNGYYCYLTSSMSTMFDIPIVDKFDSAMRVSKPLPLISPCIPSSDCSIRRSTSRHTYLPMPKTDGLRIWTSFERAYTGWSETSTGIWSGLMVWYGMVWYVRHSPTWWMPSFCLHTRSLCAPPSPTLSLPPSERAQGNLAKVVCFRPLRYASVRTAQTFVYASWLYSSSPGSRTSRVPSDFLSFLMCLCAIMP